jgi:hypothetical protein
MSMMRCGQVLEQAPQPTHLSRSTLATPFSTWIASNLQAATQSPKPMQPNLQLPGPPKKPFTAAQVL